MPLLAFVDIETIPPDEAMKSKLRPDVLRRILRDFSQAPAVKQKAPNNEMPVVPAVVAVSNSADSASQTVGDEDCPNGCTEEMFRRLALHAEYGRILCIGVILEKDGVEIRKGVFGFDKETEKLHMDESKTLRGFWQLLKQEFNPKRDLIIGHNLMDFDLPFIYKRSRIKRVKPSIQFNFARYRNAPIYDTMREWAMWNLRETSISLSLLAELLETGLDKTEGIDGSKVYDEFLAGNHALIAEYCLQDVEVSRAVYYQMI